MMLVHVLWRLYEPEDERASGRVAVSLYDGRLTVQNLAGKALPARILVPVLNASIENWSEMAEELHMRRMHPWRVELRRGLSGCRDYVLRVLRDPDILDQPVVSVLHVSMFGRLNQSVSLSLSDTAPLLAALVRDFPVPKPDDYYVEVVVPQLRGDYRQAGESSGLLEALKKIKAGE